MKLGCYAEDRWITASEDGVLLKSAVNGGAIAEVSSAGLDFGDILNHARTTGGANLRKLTFHQRGEMLK